MPIAPRRLAILLVGVLLVWTAVLCLGLQAAGMLAPSTMPVSVRRPIGDVGQGRALLSAEDDEVERRWTDQLLGDLQRSAADESVMATISELRSSLMSRENRMRKREGSDGSTSTHGSGKVEASVAPTATYQQINY